MNKEALIAECKLRIERCEYALRENVVPAHVVENSLALMRVALASLEGNYPAVPDGWQLVPKVLTPAMQDAWHAAPNGPTAEWDALLASAPKPGGAS